MVFCKNKIKYLVFGKFHCILLLNFSFDGGLIFNFYFDINMVFFLVHIFHSICVINIMSSFQKSMMSPPFFGTHLYLFMQFPLKYIATLMFEILVMLMFNMALYFKFICNSKTFDYDSPNSPLDFAFIL